MMERLVSWLCRHDQDASHLSDLTGLNPMFPLLTATGDSKTTADEMFKMKDY